MKNIILSIFFIFSVSASAKELILLTAEIPPYSMVENGVQTGISVDVVREMARRVGQNDQFRFLPWARAQNTASRKDLFGITPLSRTPDREKKFTWVAPIPEINNDYVLVSIDKKININKLDDIVNLTVGVQRGTPAQEMLKKAGFISIEPVNFEEQNVEKLRKGRIKLWAIPRLVGKYVYKTRGYNPDELNFGYVLSRPVIYFAASKSISVSDMNKWKEALDTMRADGTFEKIISKY
ncbi:transporter substrate-binding domain-containing protein [Vibrio profundum]|uniref:substrate-binding periplasmic protein n=1 Tax=Vibrio profundum TaxID=2910247 RepID=UPI003D0C2943